MFEKDCPDESLVITVRDFQNEISIDNRMSVAELQTRIFNSSPIKG